MALTDCPACNKKISDKSDVCSHCGFQVGDASAEDILRKQSLQRYKKQQSIQNQSLLAVLIFVAGLVLCIGAVPNPVICSIISL